MVVWVFELLKTKSLLFVEDNEEYAEYMIKLLSIYFSKIHHAVDIESATDTLENMTIDAIFTDIRLGAQNGLDFVEQVRKNDQNIPIVVISGHKYEELLLKAIPLQLTAYLIKPISYKELIDTLRKCQNLLLDCSSSGLIALKDGVYYVENLQALVIGGKREALNSRENLFVELLVKNRKNIITKDMIAYSVWGEEVMSLAALKNFILRIRKRFGQDFVYTAGDFGYTLSEPKR